MKNSQLSVMLSIILLCLAVPVGAQQYEFKSDGFSRQINFAKNEGTVNINQYLIKSDDYSALTQQLDKLDKALVGKQQYCAFFEAGGHAEMLTKCLQEYAELQSERDSVAQIIVQFEEDVLRLAQTFERIPLKSERLRLAKELFDAGKFREVHAIMNTQEMTQEGEALLAKKERLQSGLQETDSLLQIKAEEFMVKAQAKAVDYTDPNRIDSTALCYLQALRYNNNPQTLLDLAYFFSDNHQYDSALVYFPKVIAHPKAEEWQVASAYGKIGEMHTAIGNLSAALDAYTHFGEGYKTLHQREPEVSFYKQNLAVSYSKLGEMHTALGNLTLALTFFENYNQLEKELHEAHPQNVSFKNNLAISYHKLGSTHTALGNLPKALTFFEQDIELSEELHKAHPQNVDIKSGLAISYEKLGSTHTALGNLTLALTFFEERSRLGKELHEAYPQNVPFKNGLAISYQYLGNTHTALGNLTLALTFFENYNQLEKELHQAYPQNVEFKNNLAISYAKLGETHRALSNLPTALTFFEERSRLGRELHEAFPQNVDFKNGLAISYERLGEIHIALGDLPQALIFFEERSRLAKELHEAYPQNVSFKNGLAISYSKLGSTYAGLGNLPLALTFFEERSRLGKELHEAYPLNVDFKNGLAISYYNLGTFSRDQLKDVLKAKNYFQQAEQLWVELVRDAPEYEQFKRFLGILRGEMMKLEE